MSDALRQAVDRYTRTHADPAGIACTPLPGLFLVRGAVPGGLEHTIASPLVCLVLQGGKQVTLDNRQATFVAGDTMIVPAAMPTVSRIHRASAGKPYLAFALDLQPALIAELDVAIGDAGTAPRETSEELDNQLLGAVLRLVRLLERPGSLAVLGEALVREIHYWLLLGEHGQAIRRLGPPDGTVRRIARAVALLRRHYRHPLTIDRLAREAGMSRSAFHKPFRAVTTVSPLQFQKQLRLIEARRLMLAEGKSASRAAFDVGYASVPQFTREYARMFGLPPAKDRKYSNEEALPGAWTVADDVSR